MKSVLVVGAGAAGLQAANDLVQAGVSVTVLEAQNRLGGRIHTIRRPESSAPIELGAEFIHGLVPELWNLIESAKLATHEVPARQWRLENNRIVEDDSLFKDFEKLMELADTFAVDESFRDFLQTHSELPQKVKAFALNYVEGFNAADSREISLRAIAAYEKTNDSNSHRTFRITKGYSALVDYLAAQLKARNVVVHLNTPVKTVRWHPGLVVASASSQGAHTFDADAMLITVPLGVLQRGGPFGIEFEPMLPAKFDAAGKLRMGQVAKITLEFTSRFWPVNNFGFLHSQEALPTWWSDERCCRLVGWSGGSKALPLIADPDVLLPTAFTSLANIFGVSVDKIRAQTKGGFSHSWHQDPAAYGAYSYVPAGNSGVPRLLAEPVEGTLFFAGESTAPAGQQGTVDSALLSGKRAARQCLEAIM